MPSSPLTGMLAGDGQNRAIRVGGPLQSNQIGELIGAIVVASTVPDFSPLLLVTDSTYVIDGLTIHLPHWEDRGWLGVANMHTSLLWVKGHADIEGNIQADALVGQGSRGDPPVETDLLVPTNFHLLGARLASLSQCLAYMSVHLRNATPTQLSATRSLDLAQAAIQERTGHLPNPARIWQSLWSADLSPNISDFLWKTAHNAYQVGSFWYHVSGAEERAICPVCQVDKSMEHILVYCNAPGPTTVW
ncbi:hypothetical protein WOLCODRAFT_147557 [Wolfiporia cocos MD-104 SS10]|uniref:RNase H type-1 domain-containing protein n=1 Tax=Wolfiporia cocos (strain MD-104) TaxID=742152 RepID=A0A2H3J104_WOLCO|nr:hypothetical protein WOLCODRAFT_147557 [Wolfiporia cocos MD-104 SS10]